VAVSVTVPAGFVAGGTACGLKASGDADLALVATDDGRAVPAAAVFTTNRASAAPVNVSRQHLEATAGRAAAVVLNSGNANAATGTAGDAHAHLMCGLVAQGIGCQAQEVLVCSTGLIGIPLPIDLVVAGIPRLVAAGTATPAAAQAAAEAIMTTDTRAKQIVVEAEGFSVGGMAKGAAMLAPDMATMLAVLTTDATVDPPRLQRALRRAVERSFNQLIVDGCTSTNDTVMVLASGRRDSTPSEAELAEVLWEACSDLAGQMAADAEGATKVIRVRVVGAASAEDASAGARKIAQSLLVKCSFYGEDPYWGRVVSELGSAGIAFDLNEVRISYGGIPVCMGGVEARHPDDAVALKAVMAAPTIELLADLGLGVGEAAIVTTDLGHGYIDENMGTS
jgi:glutamate N-acetyltransferase/amino-acid N-acetyltransferase